MIMVMDNTEEEIPIIHNEPTEQDSAGEVNNTQPTSLEPAEEEKTKPRFGITLISIGCGLVLIGIVTFFVIDNSFQTSIANKAPSELAADLVSEKYNDKCEFSRHVEGDDVTIEEVYVKCEGLSGQEVLVRITDMTDVNKREISDNYVAAKYSKDVEKLITDAAVSVYGETKVLMTQDIKLSADNKDSTLEEYLADENHIIEAKIFSPESAINSQGATLKITEAIHDKLKLYNITVYKVADDDFQKDAKELSDLYKDGYFNIKREDTKAPASVKLLSPSDSVNR